MTVNYNRQTDIVVVECDCDS